MTLAVDGDAMADVVVAALNNLTHPGAVAKAGPLGRYTMLTVSTPPPDAARASCFMLVYRTIISRYVCKISVSPGTKTGAEIDTGSVALDGLEMIGGGGTTAKNTRGANNPAVFDTYFERLQRRWNPDAFGVGGSNVRIVWQPFPAETRDWIGNKATARTVPAFLVLAHELSHADRIMRGMSLSGVVGRASAGKFNATMPGTTYTTMVDPEHIEMVGFTCAEWVCRDPDVITENQMRAEHNMPIRCSY